MRLSMFSQRNVSHKTLVLSGLALFVTAFPACDPKSGSSATATVPAADSSSLTTPVSTNGGHTLGWSRTRPTHHTFQIKKSGQGSQGATNTSSQSLRAAFIKTVQSGASSEYAAIATKHAGSDAFHFDNRQRQLAADVSQDGVRVDVDTKAVRGGANFRLTSVGCKSDSTALPGIRPQNSAGRVSFAHPNVSEWYKNGPLGLEQGFDVAVPPSCRAASKDSAIELKVEVSHRLHATLMTGKDGTNWLELRDDNNQVVLHYSDLFAEDDDGKTLPTQLAFANDVLTLRVNDTDANYPLHIDPLIWGQVGDRYQASDPSANAQLGFAIAVSGDHAIVGAPFDDESCGAAGNCDTGAAYLFTLNAQGSWNQRSKFLGLPLAAPGDPGGNFGYAVAIADIGGGDKRVVIGAPRDPGLSSGGMSGPITEQGLAVWFRGRGDTWNPEGQFNGDGRFGNSVGVSSDRIVVGEPTSFSNDGAAIIYEPDVTLFPPWGEAAHIDDPANGGGLGTAVAIDGATAIIGAPTCCTTGTPANANSGAAYIYERQPTGPDAGKWFPTGSLVASDQAAGALFGRSVGVQGANAIVGSKGAMGATTGRAYIFDKTVGLWDERAKLHPIVSPQTGDDFGASVSIVGNIAAVGSPGASALGTTQAGLVYTFQNNRFGWNILNTITAQSPTPPHDPTPTANEHFGSAGSLDAGLGHLLVGGTGAKAFTTVDNAGAFWDFILRKDLGDPCNASTECASDFCVDGVCCDSACGGGTPNDCQVCNRQDIILSLNATVGHCSIEPIAHKCHTATGPCDQDTFCSGEVVGLSGPAAECPNFYLPSDTVCRDALSPCDIADTCSGDSAQCPIKNLVQPTGTVCRPPAGLCDVAELCNGTDKGCPADLLKPSFTICRLPQGGECDQFEVCDGQQVDCPADGNVIDNTPCSTGSCQQGICRAEADLGVAISGPPTVTPNQDLTYAVAVTNYGRSSATNVGLTVTLSDGATLTSASGDATCQSVATGVQCTIASLAANQTTTIMLAIHPPAQPTMQLTATVGSDLPDPDMANNTATLTQNLLSPRIAGGGAGCSAVSGGTFGFGQGAALLGLLALLGRRRRRAA